MSASSIAKRIRREVLLDEQLRSFGITPSDVAGYHDIVTDHLSAASQVSSGKADIGVGSLHAAHMAGTDFIPVISEQYDVVVLKQTGSLFKACGTFLILRNSSLSFLNYPDMIRK